MEINIGEVIAKRRREMHWTQAQLAEKIGVSTPAVSKWETGATYPDIALLSPLARALETTVDALLSFQNELSMDEVTRLKEQAWEVYKNDGFDAGWEFCIARMREYPNSIPLKFQLGNLFQGFLLFKPALEKEEIARVYRWAAEIYEDVRNSGQGEYVYPATAILIGYYAMLKDLDRAQALLKSLPKAEVDTELFEVSITALRGENEKACALMRRSIQKSVLRIAQNMQMLCAYAREDGDRDKAMALAQTNYELFKLFGMGAERAYPDLIKTAIDCGDVQKALDDLETYAGMILTGSVGPTKSPIFPEVEIAQFDDDYVRKVYAKNILLDTGYAPIKNTARFRAVAEKLEKNISE